ncbi:MAG: hypothetical protein ACTSQE_07355 [Candidatus Heimdallarchaeaceae archaeon]
MPGEYQIKSFRGGKSEYTDKGVSGSFKSGSNLNIRTETDVLQANQALKDDDGGIVTDLIKFWVKGTDGHMYGFGDTGKIYQRNSSTGVYSLKYTDPDGEIRGASMWFNPTTNYIYWSTSTKLHRKELPGLSNWTDVDADASWPKINLSSTDYHTMAQANGSLMICNKDFLAMVGYDDSYTNEALNLFPGLTSKTLIERNNQVIIGAGDDDSQSYLFTWEQTALSWINKHKIPVKNINAIADAEILTMHGGDDKLYFTNMVDNMPIMTMDGEVNPNGVAEDEGLALYGVYGGDNTGVWSYGRKRRNGVYALNLEYGVTADEIGAIYKLGEDLLVSFKNGSDYGVLHIDTSNKADAEYISLDLKSPHKYAQITNWEKVDLITDAIPTDCGIEVQYRTDRNTGSWIAAQTADGSTEVTEGINPTFFINSNGKIIEVKIKLNVSGNTTPTIHEWYLSFN